jgi:hypothetical protein
LENLGEYLKKLLVVLDFLSKEKDWGSDCWGCWLSGLYELWQVHKDFEKV